MKPTALLALLILVFASSPAASQTATPAEFDELCRIFEGRWISDVTWIADWPGFGKRGDTVTGYWETRMDIDGKVFVARFYGGNGTARGMRFYDPGARQIRAISVNSGGRATDAIFWKENGEWWTKGTATLANGSKVQHTLRLILSDGGNTHAWRGTVTVDGKETDKLTDVWRRVSEPR
jgi:hypothetical protein